MKSLLYRGFFGKNLQKRIQSLSKKINSAFFEYKKKSGKIQRNIALNFKNLKQK